VTRSRIAVLASGGGSNLRALADHLARLGDARAGDIVLVASDRGDAGALERGRRAGAATARLATASHPSGASLEALLVEHRIDLVVLAGYLRLVPLEVTRRFVGRMVNVHPALLPDFGGPGMYGARVHRAVLAAGAAVSGPTVHFVDEVFDHGAVIAQWRVPVLARDDEHALAARVLRAEHLLYPRIVQAVAAGAVRLDERGRLEAPSLAPVLPLPPFDPELDDAAHSHLLDRLIAS
jgi:formyltetrahydrofolate-dependent phosphoribosylglycinamide formyltransferase